MGSTPNHIVDFEKALEIVLTRARAVSRPAETEKTPLLQARTRILAQPILADRDQPPFDRSTRDGFALRAADWTPHTHLEIIGQVRAGDLWQRPPLAPSQAIEIMTGAPIPPGADAVLMVEHAVRTGKPLCSPPHPHPRRKCRPSRQRSCPRSPGRPCRNPHRPRRNRPRRHLRPLDPRSPRHAQSRHPRHRR
jgi:molybdopterin biosynthesis enzyme